MQKRGRKPKAVKKEREAIYADPTLLAWLREQAELQQCTVSEFICSVLEKAKEQEGNS